MPGKSWVWPGKLSMAIGTHEIIGVVLCGGMSTRMGRDKGLIVENGQTWAARAAAVLINHVDRIVFSVRREQLGNYSQIFAGAEFVTDSIAAVGPLGGLMSVHAQFPDAHLFLLACDMTSVSDREILPLLSASGDVVAYRHKEIFEPLCAFYSAAACDEIRRRVGANLDLAPGLQKLLHELRVTALEPAHYENLQSRNTVNQ